MKKTDIDKARALVHGSAHFDDPEDAQDFLDAVKIAEAEAREQRWAAEDEEAYRRSGKARADEHRAKAKELANVRAKFERSAEQYAAQAAKVVRGKAPDAHLAGEDFAAFCKSADRLIADSSRADKLAKLERAERRAAKAALVINEPGPYDLGSPHSWVRDTLAHATPEEFGVVTRADMAPGEVAKRLEHHSKDVTRALLKRGKYGRRVEAMLAERNRHEDPELHERKAREEIRDLRLSELRAFTSGGGTTATAGAGAAAFVPPAVLMNSWAEYRSPYRAFADQCNISIALPAYGMTVYLPAVSAPTGVTTQAELSGVTENDPTATLIPSPVVAKVGQITITQQWLDRVGPGIAGDQVLFAQLREQTDAQVDAYALSQAMANAQPVTNAGTFALATASGEGGFVADVAKAKKLVSNAPGTRLRPTHGFAPGNFIDYLSGLADASGRPLFLPELNASGVDPSDPNDLLGEGYSGYTWGALRWFIDDNLPPAGSNLQLVVTRPSTIHLLEGGPMYHLWPETYAGNLAPVLGARVYVAAIARFPSGVATISGAAYTATTFA